MPLVPPQALQSQFPSFLQSCFSISLYKLIIPLLTQFPRLIMSKHSRLIIFPHISLLNYRCLLILPSALKSAFFSPIHFHCLHGAILILGDDNYNDSSLYTLLPLNLSSLFHCNDFFKYHYCA